jgi:hypothetical protein
MESVSVTFMVREHQRVLLGESAANRVARTGRPHGTRRRVANGITTGLASVAAVLRLGSRRRPAGPGHARTSSIPGGVR